MTDEVDHDLTSLTADVVCAYVSNNNVTAGDLAALIGSTYQALRAAAHPAPSEPETAKPDRAAIKKSLSGDHITSFIDGRKYKSLTRHLGSRGMTADQYRQTYGLPKDYPMVAPSYSAKRSELAKALGLGRKAGAAAGAAPASTPARGKSAKAKGSPAS